MVPKRLVLWLPAKACCSLDPPLSSSFWLPCPYLRPLRTHSQKHNVYATFSESTEQRKGEAEGFQHNVTVFGMAGPDDSIRLLEDGAHCLRCVYVKK